MRMRMLVAIVGLLTLPALATAEGDYGGTTDQNQPMGSSSDVSPGAEQRTGMPSGQMGQTGQVDPQQEQQIFRSRETWELKGTVASVDSTGNKIHVDRQNLPPAELSVSTQTKVKLNGKQATLNDLQPGTEIRAKFNLAEDNAVATELEAKSKGEKTMQRGAKEMEKGAKEMEHGAEQMQNR